MNAFSYNYLSINRSRKLIASLLSKIKLDSALLSCVHLYHSNNIIRAINYHYTPFPCALNFEHQLQLFRQYFSNVLMADLDNFYEEKHWSKPKPGLLISFDDGLSSNYHIAAPLLEKYGFKGWFFIVPDFISCPEAEQEEFARDHFINYYKQGGDQTPLAMSWKEIIDLDKRGHVIGSHTKTHLRMGGQSSKDTIEKEVFQSKCVLQGKLGHEIDVFAWVGGEIEHYNPTTAQCIKQAGYKYSFMTNSALIHPTTDPFQMRRTEMEAWWPLDVVTFQLCGIVDLLYYSKVRYVRNLTNVRLEKENFEGGSGG